MKKTNDVVLDKIFSGLEYFVIFYPVMTTVICWVFLIVSITLISGFIFGGVGVIFSFISSALLCTFICAWLDLESKLGKKWYRHTRDDKELDEDWNGWETIGGYRFDFNKNLSEYQFRYLKKLKERGISISNYI